jgi:hypothetical protein
MSTDMRRDPVAIEAALVLDPKRRELYVEGPRDRQLVLWLLGDVGTRDSVVQDISGVEIPVSEGGERGRLMAFADRMTEVDQIRYFADADYDRLLGRAVPSNGWLTDGRDMESYLILTGCPTKALRLGAARPRREADSAVRQCLAASRRAAYLRIADSQMRWHLPFQETPPSRKARVRGWTLEFAERPWLTALLDASIGRGHLIEVESVWNEAATDFADTPDEQVVHGKDFLAFLGEFFRKSGVERPSGPKLVWSAIERARVRRYPYLSEVLTYVA